MCIRDSPHPQFGAGAATATPEHGNLRQYLLQLSTSLPDAWFARPVTDLSCQIGHHNVRASIPTTKHDLIFVGDLKKGISLESLYLSVPQGPTPINVSSPEL